MGQINRTPLSATELQEAEERAREILDLLEGKKDGADNEFYLVASTSGPFLARAILTLRAAAEAA